MSLATHSGQLFQVTIVPLDNCSSQNLFLRSFTNGHLQRGRSLEWTIEYLPQLLQSLISLTDDNRKNKDQNSNKRFALFTLSSFPYKVNPHTNDNLFRKILWHWFCPKFVHSQKITAKPLFQSFVKKILVQDELNGGWSNMLRAGAVKYVWGAWLVMQLCSKWFCCTSKYEQIVEVEWMNECK